VSTLFLKILKLFESFFKKFFLPLSRRFLFHISLSNWMGLNDQINLVQLQLENHEERLRQICLDHPRQALS
jgi:hypothetical protein